MKPGIPKNARFIVPWIKQPITSAKQFFKRMTSSRKVFIDCGANTGTVFKKYFAGLKGFEFYLFEPQPELVESLKKVVEESEAEIITFENKAVWTNNEKLNFYLATRSGVNFKGGSTLLKGHTNNAVEVDYDHPLEVEAIDFSAWLSNNFDQNDYLTVKMDIEGSEYPVLEKIISDGRLNFINELYIEFHHQMNESITEERHKKLIKQLKANVKLIHWY